MKGLLLVNLGTPASPARGDVAAYLNEFLADPRVVDLPRLLWLPLLRLVIVPLRAPRSASAYQKVWTEAGSPLLVNSKAIADALEKELGSATTLRLAMRYGAPSIASKLEELQSLGVTELTVLPLYPQFSYTTTETVFDAVKEALKGIEWQPKVIKLRDYHDHPQWVAAVSESIRRFQAQKGRPEKLLFSMHGIPQRYVSQGDPYYAQCQASVELIADSLDLGADEFLLTFQSRVGREPWLQPYTDVTLQNLAAAGIKHVQVVCPGFSADCLETLEEIAMENRENFLHAGGNILEYIPALNDSQQHIAALAEIFRTAGMRPTANPFQSPE